MDRPTIVYIARTVSSAFLELQQGLANPPQRHRTLTVEQLAAIDSLPSGVLDKRSPVDGSLIELVEMTGRKRIAGFPKMCCADAVATLGIIYTMAGVKPQDIIEVKAVPRKPNPAFNFHKWLCIEGLHIDVTLGQFHPLGDEVGDAVAFTQHPFEVDDEYTIERERFVAPSQVVKFAEHVGFAYVFNE